MDQCYEQYTFVPIKPTETEPATQPIRGLDATEAQAIISGRPDASPQAFLDKVAEKVSPSKLNVAKTYVGS
jgi:hypothetical protein